MTNFTFSNLTVTFSNVANGASTASTNMMTYTQAWTGSTVTGWTITPLPVPPRGVWGGKYRVRCRGCARWAKVLKDEGWGQWTVHCDRCLGENEGFAA